MKPPVPSESWPAKPVSRLSPSAASANIRKGIRIACSQYSFASAGTAKRASSEITVTKTVLIERERVAKKAA